jgi:hypothetical protein
MIYPIPLRLSRGASAWRNPRIHLSHHGSDPASLAPEASPSCTPRSANAGGPVASTPEADGTTLSQATAERQARPLTAHLRRAIETRTGALEQEQAAAATEYEGLYERAGTILAEMIERQQRLRTFREILLNRGDSA